MTDRKPTYPHRVAVTREDGSQEMVTWEYADNPITEGTPLSKATLLDDATAQAILPGVDDPTVNQALAALHEKGERLGSITLTLPASGWQGSAAPYTQTVAVEGMTESWKPSAQRPGASYSEEEYDEMGLEEKRAITEALGYLSEVRSSEGQLVFACYDKKPAVDLKIQLEGVM